jgi:hypothetical protein
MTIQPHEAAGYWQADQIAECLEVNEEAYIELWNVVVPLYDDKPRGECPGEVCYDIASYWDKISDPCKLEVNRALSEAAREREESYQRLLRDVE